MAWSRRGFGQYVASEWHVEIHSDRRRSRGRVPLVFCHGLLSEGRVVRFGAGMIPGYVYYDTFSLLAERVGPVLSGDVGGAASWASDTVVAAGNRIDQLISWAGTNLGTRTDRVVIAGESMGSLAALNWAWRNPLRTAAIWLRGPIVRFEDFYNLNPGLQATIDAAYGNHAGWLAGLPTHDPEQNMAALANMGRRTRLDYTGQDELIPATWAPEYAAATGASAFYHHGDHAAGVLHDPVPVAEWLRNVLRTPRPL